jgi:hypothetical protein
MERRLGLCLLSRHRADNYNASTTKYNVNDFNDPSYLVVPDFC